MPLGNISQDTTLALLQVKAQETEVQHNLNIENVVNWDMPGYKLKEVSTDFGKELSKLVEHGDVAGIQNLEIKTASNAKKHTSKEALLSELGDVALKQKFYNSNIRFMYDNLSQAISSLKG